MPDSDPTPSIPLAGHTDEELARRAQSGSLASFGELVSRFEARLFNFLLRRTGSPADAEDLTQEAFIRAWQRIGTYRSQWRFSTWLFTIAARLAAARCRKAGWGRTGPVTRDLASRDPDPARAVSDRELRERVWDVAGATLTDDQHTALWLKYAEGLAVREIAEVMGRTQVGVRVLLFRARTALGAALGAAPEARGAAAPEPRRPATIREHEQLAGTL